MGNSLDNYDMIESVVESRLDLEKKLAIEIYKEVVKNRSDINKLKIIVDDLKKDIDKILQLDYSSE